MGAYSSCAILDNGDAKCWGSDEVGQLGYGGDTGDQMHPVLVSGNHAWDSSTGTVQEVPENYSGSGEFSLVKDLWVDSWASGSSVTRTTAVGDIVFFTAHSNLPEYGTSGDQLFKTDGTEAGTDLVKNMNWAGQSGYPTRLIAVGDTLFFRADEGTHGRELWKSDGTEAGTVMIKDLNPGGDSSVGDWTPTWHAVIGDTYYFQANDGTHGWELWKSDGTEAGTVMVKDISPGGDGSSPSQLTAVGDTLYFVASDGWWTSGMQLWKSDGTEAGTMKIEDENTPDWITLANLAAVGDTLYFEGAGRNDSYQDGTTGAALWKTDGTASGTVMVKDINTMSNASGSDLAWLTDFGGVLYFTGDDGTHGRELWRSDGTESGTVMVKDINPGNASGSVVIGNTDYAQISVTSDHMLFRADDGTHGLELWRSDGTESGTVMVKDIYLGNEGGNPSLTQSAVLGDTIFFIAREGPDPADGSMNHYRLWQSNGTSSGTFLAGASNAGYIPTIPSYIAFVGNTVVMQAGWPGVGRELVALDPINISGLGGGQADTQSEDIHFRLVSLADSDGDGLPDELPADYDPAEGPTPGLVADDDDDNDGLPDLEESATGTDSTNPDTDGDGYCDGPIAFAGVCEAGPDAFPTDPTEWLDFDGDGIGNEADEDDDNDGISDLDELAMGHDPTSPDTDGDGYCDGAEAVAGVCEAGPDAFPTDPSAHADTDGDGLPDTITGTSTSVPPLVEDTDDDGDGLEDASETDTGVYVDGTDTGTDPLNPDTDSDGICDGPNAVPPICLAGPDDDPHGSTFGGRFFGLRNSQTAGFQPAGDASPGTTFEVYPGLPPGMSLDESTGVISGTPANAMEDTTFNLWANQTDGTSVRTTFQFEVLEDTDGDGLPDELPDYYDSTTGEFVEDDDDDNDGVTDLDESATGTGSTSADTDGDGYCDGAEAVAGVCEAGPDAFPTDPSAHADTDGDGLPDTITGTSTSVPPLVEDTDDDGDGLEDASETDTGVYVDGTDTGTDPLNPDTDSDGICDGPNAVPPICLAGPDDDPHGSTFGGRFFGLRNSQTAGFQPAGDASPGTTFEVYPGLPPGMSLDESTGVISGTPANAMEDTTFNLWANQTDGTSVRTTFQFEVLEDTDGDGLPDELPDYYDSTTGEFVEDDDDDNDGITDADEREAGTDPLDPDTDGDGICDGPVSPANSDCTAGSNNSGGSFFAKYLWCCWPILLLLLLLVVLLRDEERRETVLGVTGPMPGNTTAEPAFIGGWGLKDDPFVLRPVEGLAYGDKVLSEETITIKGISPGYLMGAKDLRQGENGLRASMVNVKGAAKRGHEELPRMREIEVDETGDVQIRLHFQDHPGTKAGGEYRTEVKLGSASVYLQWAVRVEPSEEAAAAALLAKEEQERAAKEAEEEAAAAALLAKEEQERAGKAAASKPSDKEEKKQEELRRVKERASSIDFETLGEASSSELKSAVEEGAETLEVASASEFADSGSARISDSAGTSVIAWTGKDGNVLTGVSGVTRTFAAASIVLVKDDLQVIKGIGPFLEEKLNALGITTYRQIANMDPEMEDQVNEAIEFFPGRVKRDQWVTQAKILLGEDVKLDEKALKQTEELQRVAAKADSIDFATLGVATASEKDDLQTIKGIGPFIEEKLYALGIYTFSQISKMTPEIEEEVNVAIEFFPGRVKRDEWAKQAGEILRD